MIRADEGLLLKTDALGRVKVPRAMRLKILDRFEGSGMSGKAFAAHIGVKYPTFATWVQARRRERGEYTAKGGKPVKGKLTLVEAIVEDAQTGSGSLEVETKEGLKVRVGAGGEIELAVALLRALKDAEL